MYARRERDDREIGVEVVGDPALQLAQRLPIRRAGRKLHAELGLPARPLHEDDQPASDLERSAWPEVLLYQRER